MSVSTYTWQRGPWSSISPSAASSLDFNNISVENIRPAFWHQRTDAEQETKAYNHEALLSFLEDEFSTPQFATDNPVVKFRCDAAPDFYTTNDKAIASSDTYMELNDSIIAEEGRIIRCPKYGVEYRVLDVDDDHSEGWTNGAGDACNVYYEQLTGPVIAIPLGNYFHFGEGVMGEQGEPKRAMTSVPGDWFWNSMSYVGLFDGITDIQQKANMLRGWGTHPRLRDDVYFQHRYSKQQAVLFAHRHFGTDSQGAEGNLWIANGIVPQIQTNILSADDNGVNLTYGILNDHWERLFDSELTAPEKHHFCDAAQYRTIRMLAQQAGALEGEYPVLSTKQAMDTTGMDSYGVPMMDIVLQSGMHIYVRQLRKAFSSPDFRGFGVTLDRGQHGVVFGHYNGINEVWHDDIETNPRRITMRSDAVVDSWVTLLPNESLNGLIFGGVPGLVG